MSKKKPAKKPVKKPVKKVENPKKTEKVIVPQKTEIDVKDALDMATCIENCMHDAAEAYSAIMRLYGEMAFMDKNAKVGNIIFPMAKSFEEIAQRLSDGYIEVSALHGMLNDALGGIAIERKKPDDMLKDKIVKAVRREVEYRHFDYSDENDPDNQIIKRAIKDSAKRLQKHFKKFVSCGTVNLDPRDHGNDGGYLRNT